MEKGAFETRPPAFSSPIMAAMPAPMMMPHLSELGISVTSLSPRPVMPSTRKMTQTSICSATIALTASGPGSKFCKYSSTTGMAGVIQPGTSGTPISAGSMKPMPQITTPASAASYGSPRYC